MKEPSKADGFFGELDRTVYDKVNEGKSALRIALELSDDQYNKGIDELKDKIGNGGENNKINNLINLYNSFAYAFKILWFRIAFEKYDGQNTDDIFLTELGVNEQANERVGYIKISEPFPLNGNDNGRFVQGFREYVWFNANARNTQDLYNVVRRAISLDKEERFNPECYPENEYTFVRKTLSRTNDEWHRGDDFREVMGKYCDRECNIEEEDEWIKKIVAKFPKRDFAQCDFYLRWNPGNVNIEGVVCWDKFNLESANNVTLSCTGMGDVTRNLPANGRITQPVPMNVTSVVAECEIGDNILSSFNFDQIDTNALCEGIWFRHGRTNDSLWERATSLKDCKGKELRKKRMIPANKKEALIICRCGSECLDVQLPSGVKTKGSYHVLVRNSNFSVIQEYNLTLLEICDRSVEVRKITARGFEAEINTCGVKIVVDEEFECVGEYEDYLLVEASQALSCEGLANGEEPEWSIDKEVISRGEKCVLPKNISIGRKIRISCRVGERVDRRTIVVLPSDVFSAITGKTNLPDGWKIDQVEKTGEDYIDAAIEGVEVVSIINPDGVVCARIARQIDEPIWWLQTAAGYNNDTQCCQERDFKNDNVNGWFLAFPYKSRQQIVDSLILDGSKVKPNLEEFVGYFRVGLSSLLKGFGTIIHEDALSSNHTLKIGGQIVAKWTAKPNRLTFVQTQSGLAVYVPENYDCPFVGVAYYPDNIDNDFLKLNNIQEFETSQGGDRRLICIEDWKNNLIETYHTSEIFMGLRLSLDANAPMFFGDFLKSDKFYLVKVSDGDCELRNDSVALQILRLLERRFLPEDNPYRFSRIWRRLFEGNVLQSVIEDAHDVGEIENNNYLNLDRRIVASSVVDFFSRRERKEYEEYDKQAEETLKKMGEFDSAFKVALQMGFNPLVQSNLFSGFSRVLFGSNNGGVSDFIKENPSAIATPILVQFLLNNNFPYANFTDLLGLPEINGLGVSGIVGGFARQLAYVRPHPHTQGPDNLCLCFGGNNVLIVDRVPHIQCQLDVNSTRWDDKFLKALKKTLGKVVPNPNEEVEEFENLFEANESRIIAACSIDLCRKNNNVVFSYWAMQMIEKSVVFVYNRNGNNDGYTDAIRCVILGGFFLGLRAYVSNCNGIMDIDPRLRFDYNSLVTNIYLDADRQRVYGKVFVYSMCFMLSMLHCLNLKENVQ